MMTTRNAPHDPTAPRSGSAAGLSRCVLLSGGMGSALALHWALEQGPAFALSIDYRRRHPGEIDAARRIAFIAGVELVEASVQIPASGLDATLLARAAVEAQARGAAAVVFGATRGSAGMAAADRRVAFLSSLSSAYSLGLGVRVEAPFGGATKRERLDTATPAALGSVAFSWSCIEPREMGFLGPCEDCEGCEARAEALAGRA